MVNGWLSLETAPHSGSRNMAVDEWLLEQAISADQLTLRLYQWEEPTLSLGYFQEKTGTPLPEALQPLPRVRRLTGGGAILHDQELTYSLCLPASHELSSTPVELYALMHRWFIAALAEQGIECRFRETEQAERNGSFLCFFRGDRHDVLCGSDKVLGSAQRRRKGAILQHGSLILRTSAAAPEIQGLDELSGKPVQLEPLINHLVQAAAILTKHWQPLDWNQPEFLPAIKSLEQKYQQSPTAL